MCKWRSALNPDYHCRVSAEPGSDYCIFHEPGEKDVQRFKQKFYEQIDGDGPEEARNPRYDFRGYFFPTGIVASGGSREAGQLILPKEIAGDLIGGEATIKGDANFGGAMFKGSPSFKHAMIEGHASFFNARIGGHAYFEDVTINGDANFMGATIGGHAFFVNATIERGTNFVDATIGANASFERATIKGDAFFNIAMIGGDASFENAMIGGDASFENATIKRGANFCGATFKGHVGVSETKMARISLGTRRPTILWLERNREGVTLKKWSSGHMFWTFARRTFAKMDERERADAAYYFEKLWRRRSRLASSGRERLLAIVGYPFEVVFLRLPIAYGTSLVRPLISWAVLIVLFGGLYAGFPSLIGRMVKSVWTLSNWVIALHFSVTTFTTLGLGDIHPGRLLGKALTSIEAVVGGVLMALTVVVISRKLMR